jgi:hypothetical protein
MIEEARKEVASEIHQRLIGGTVKEVGVRIDELQVWVALLDIEKDGKVYRFFFPMPQPLQELSPQPQEVPP